MRLFRLNTSPRQAARRHTGRTRRSVLRKTAALMPVLPLLALSFSVAGGAAGPAAAADAIPAYAADVLYQMPDGSESTGRVVQSGPDMRMERNDGGRAMVQILRQGEGMMYMLDPARQVWFKVRTEPDPQAGSGAYKAPCGETMMSADLCRRLGTEVASGITAELWEIGPPGGADVSRILWDGTRQRALREQGPDGTVLTRTFQAMVEIEGRSAEHWAITLTRPGQPPESGAWYFDPELRVDLREEIPGGPTRSLRNIVVGPVDPAAFAPPAGWTEVEPPVARRAPGAGAPGAPVPPPAN